MRPKSELPKTREQARAEGWKPVCFEVGDSPDGRLILNKGRLWLAIPYTTTERRSFRFKEASLIVPGNAKRKWLRKSGKLLQLTGGVSPTVGVNKKRNPRVLRKNARLLAVPKAGRNGRGRANESCHLRKRDSGAG
jgi:hypothetical protein